MIKFQHLSTCIPSILTETKINLIVQLLTKCIKVSYNFLYDWQEKKSKTDKIKAKY